MAVYTEKKTYHTKAHMGMIDVTEDFQHAVEEACRQHGISAGTVTGFTTGGVAGLTTLEFEPGIVNHDLKAALDVFSPYLDEKGRVVPYWHHETWHDDNGSSHIKAALLSPFITVPFVNGKITVGPWQNLTLIECDTRDRVRDIVFQVMGEGVQRRCRASGIQAFRRSRDLGAGGLCLPAPVRCRAPGRAKRLGDATPGTGCGTLCSK